MPFTLTVTTAGRAAIVNAANDGTNAVRIASVGVSAGAFTPGPGITSLPGEIKRITTIAGDAVAPDTIHITIRDESSAVYAVRSIALYLNDGTVFATFSQAAPLVEKSSQAMLLLALDVQFADIAAASLSFGATDFLNPPATEETPGVIELATDAETHAGTDDRRAVTPKGLSFAFAARLASWGADIWRASNDGAGSGLDADLLDGQQGSFYANIPARLGYTPANRAGDTFTGNVAISSPGTATFFVEAGAGGLAFQRFQRSGRVRWDFGMNASAESGGLVGSDLFINRFDDAGAVIDTPFLMYRGTGELRLQGGRAWHSSNDGAGSGLDADLLDGQDGSFYTNIVARLGYAPVSRSGDTMYGPLDVPQLYVSAGDLILRRTDVAWGYILRPNQAGYRNLMMAVVGGGGLDNLEFNAFNVTNRGNVMWHAGNDGAGSGMDADLLRGRDLINAPAFAGTILTLNNGRLLLQHDGNDVYLRPTNAGGSLWLGAGNSNVVQITPAGNLSIGGATAWHAGNDGAGSGMDADLLDGQQGSYYADIPARLGYTPANSGGQDFGGTVSAQTPNFATTGGLVLRGNPDSGIAYLQITNASRSAEWGHLAFDGTGRMRWSGTLSRAGAQVWDAANDGAGSGMDADLLDGRQASEFALRSEFGASLGVNGFQQHPSGLIDQWGKVRGYWTAENTIYVEFPVPFPNECFNVSLTGFINAPGTARDLWVQLAGEPSQQGFTIQLQSDDQNDRLLHGVDWTAKGR